MKWRENGPIRRLINLIALFAVPYIQRISAIEFEDPSDITDIFIATQGEISAQTCVIGGTE
jgi:hypothetical protein